MARTEQLKPGRVYSLINVKSDLQKKTPPPKKQPCYSAVCMESHLSLEKNRKITVEQCTMQQLNNARLQFLALVHLSHKGTPYITQLL